VAHSGAGWLRWVRAGRVGLGTRRKSIDIRQGRLGHRGMGQRRVFDVSKRPNQCRKQQGFEHQHDAATRTRYPESASPVDIRLCPAATSRPAHCREARGLHSSMRPCRQSSEMRPLVQSIGRPLGGHWDLLSRMRLSPTTSRSPDPAFCGRPPSCALCLSRWLGYAHGQPTRTHVVGAFVQWE
jgi:hypothetical protein